MCLKNNLIFRAIPQYGWDFLARNSRKKTSVFFLEFQSRVRLDPPNSIIQCIWGFQSVLEEDKRATTNVQNDLVFSFLFSVKGMNYQKSPGVKFLKMCEKCGKSAKKVWKSAETILFFGCCPWVLLWGNYKKCWTAQPIQEWAWIFNATSVMNCSSFGRPSQTFGAIYSCAV